MAYTPFLPNQFDQNLIPVDIRAKYFEEYLGLSPFTTFMGSSPEDAIQIFETNNGDGLSYRVSFRKDLNYQNPIIGFDQAEGAEQAVQIFYDEIALQLRRFVDVLMGVPLVRKATPIDVYGTLRPLLLNAQRRNLVLSLLNAACAPTASGGLYNVAASIPSYDRAIFAGLSPARGAWYANINAGVAAQNGGATAATNGLSVAHLRLLKTYAIRGGASLEMESRIKPIQLKDKRGFPEELYIYLMDTPSYISLANDPGWTQFVYRGVVQNDNQPEGISGARYRGMVEGVMIYECPELNRYAITSGGFTSSWNLFLGAQAFGLCWAMRPWFEMESRDFNLNAAMAVCEIRGQKAFVFPSFQNTAVNVERGIIHSFVRTS